MEIFWWILISLLLLVGLAGTVLPLLPGTILILGAGVLNYFTVATVGWQTLAGLAVLMLVSQVVDFAGGALGAKWFGATRWGAIGALLGAVVGIFFGLVGIVLGPLIGALAGEILGGKGILPAGKSSWGTFLGTTAAMILKFFIGLTMAIWLVIASIW